MSEEKLKNVDVNNSDPVFVTGVLYGIMFGIEMVLDDRLPDKNNDANVIVNLLNTTLSHCALKISQMFELIKKHQRVPDLMKIIEEKKKEDEKLKLKEGLKKTIDEIYAYLKEGKNENK